MDPTLLYWSNGPARRNSLSRHGSSGGENYRGQILEEHLPAVANIGVPRASGNRVGEVTALQRALELLRSLLR